MGLVLFFFYANLSCPKWAVENRLGYDYMIGLSSMIHPLQFLFILQVYLPFRLSSSPIRNKKRNIIIYMCVWERQLKKRGGRAIENMNNRKKRTCLCFKWRGHPTLLVLLSLLCIIWGGRKQNKKPNSFTCNERYSFIYQFFILVNSV